MEGDDVDGLSYHAVKVYIGNKLYRIKDNYAFQLHCTKCAGWQLYFVWMGKEKLLGGEYDGEPFCIEVGNKVICGKKPKVIEEPTPIGGWNGVVNNP